MVEGGSARRFAVVDEVTGTLMWQGPKLNEKGAVVGFDHDPLQPLLLSHTTDVTFLNGKVERVSTAFDAFRKVNDRYTPEETSKITGIPVDTLVETARDFFKLKGVCDDGWYSSRNANDVEAFGMMNVINLFTGRFDREGGLIATQGGGYGGAPGIKRKDGMCLGPTGVTWDPPKGKPLDKEYYPEGIGSFHSTFEAMKTGKPYPIRALFITGGAMFHREANSARLIEAFKALDLIVSQDLMPQESNDYADYVLPSTFFLENHEYLGVTYARDGYVQRSSAEIDPPEGVEARHDIWQFLEILRRAYPERAARVATPKRSRTAPVGRPGGIRVSSKPAGRSGSPRRTPPNPVKATAFRRTSTKRVGLSPSRRSTTTFRTGSPSRRRPARPSFSPSSSFSVRTARASVRFRNTFRSRPTRLRSP